MPGTYPQHSPSWPLAWALIQVSRSDCTTHASKSKSLHNMHGLPIAEHTSTTFTLLATGLGTDPSLWVSLPHTCKKSRRQVHVGLELAPLVKRNLPRTAHSSDCRKPKCPCAQKADSRNRIPVTGGEDMHTHILSLPISPPAGLGHVLLLMGI